MSQQIIENQQPTSEDNPSDELAYNSEPSDTKPPLTPEGSPQDKSKEVSDDSDADFFRGSY